jgi:anti-sigma B factor antagonist
MPDPAPITPLTLDIERDGTTAVVKCHGRLQAGVNEFFYNTVRKLIPDSKRIVLDFTDLTRMDSMGLGALVRLYVSARNAGCTVELIHVSKHIRELLGITNLWQCFATIGEHGIKMG